MNEHKFLLLSGILAHAHNFPWDGDLFIPKDGDWNNDTKGMVVRIDIDDLDDGNDFDDLPIVKHYNLRYVLSMAAVQTIVSNAESQKPAINEDQLLQAFLFYFDHDAFITFGNG
jgi:hypothetical protein